MFVHKIYIEYINKDEKREVSFDTKTHSIDMVREFAIIMSMILEDTYDVNTINEINPCNLTITYHIKCFDK